MGQGYYHLGLDERIEIEKGVESGESLRVIAARLGRALGVTPFGWSGGCGSLGVQGFWAGRRGDDEGEEAFSWADCS